MSAAASLEKFGKGAQGAAVGLAAIAALALGVYVWRKGLSGAAAGAAGAAGKIAGGAAVGAVKGISEGVGIPDTNETECQKAIREGRWWDASFACPAGTFLKGVTGIGGPVVLELAPDSTQNLIDNAQADTGAELRGL